MEPVTPESSELSKGSNRRIDKLTDILKEIRHRPDPATELLLKFQHQYRELHREEKPWFFDAIIRKIEIQKSDLEEQVRLLLDADQTDPIGWSRRVTELRRKMQSPRMRAFRRFLNISGGFKFLLDLRADVLVAQRQTSLELDPLDEEISHLFNSWFQHGFLFLQEITRDSPFRQIGFLKEHDMVHPMTSLEEMGHRLGEDRRCFALYHRAMPEEPVVFIEVALTRGIARSLHDVIRDNPEEPESAHTPDTAIFYSINNTQNGLAGLGLGKVLIFQVVDAIKNDCPSIRTFATLSPIPGFWPRYLKPILEGKDEAFVLKREAMGRFVSERAARTLAERVRNPGGDLAGTLLEILSDPHWIEDQDFVKWLKKPLSEITHHYVTKEKNRQGKPLNPVANFHMGNGANVSFKNIDFGANRSERGLTDSCGMMVNYVYSGNWLQEIRRTMVSWLPWNV